MTEIDPRELPLQKLALRVSLAMLTIRTIAFVNGNTVAVERCDAVAWELKLWNDKAKNAMPDAELRTLCLETIEAIERNFPKGMF